jgi:hypothetical protein
MPAQEPETDQTTEEQLAALALELDDGNRMDKILDSKPKHITTEELVALDVQGDKIIEA